jgi:arabinogalactan endo-1,4-beta-galactosidase
MKVNDKGSSISNINQLQSSKSQFFNDQQKSRDIAQFLKT